MEKLYKNLVQLLAEIFVIKRKVACKYSRTDGVANHGVFLRNLSVIFSNRPSTPFLCI
jgi:hypothetical protein